MTNEKNRNQYLVTRMDGKIFSFLLQDGKAAEIHCDRENSDSTLGNIYIGKIKNIAKNLGAAFVETAPGQVCYLPLQDMKHPVYTKKGASKLPQAGDELLVQVSREEIKTKYPSVTTNLTLHGKYMLLTTGNCQLSVSSKLPEPDRERLRGLIRSLEAHPDEQNMCLSGEPDAACTEGISSVSPGTYGWLLRTNAGTASEELLRKDFLRLRSQYELLMQQVMYRTCFSCLRETPAAWLGRLSNLYDSETDRILTDDPQLYQNIQDYFSEYQPEDLDKLTLYEDRMVPMAKLYSLEHQLCQALSERVWLNSGGYLVIQPTEALTVIDVNTGRYEGGKNKEAAFLKINLEAAAETARQIRLRNMSGIIIVDFINMEKEESVKTLLSVLREHLQKDPVQTVLVDMTRLSLVEITRKKVSKTLAESMHEIKSKK